MKFKKSSHILIIGIKGGLAQILSRLLLDKYPQVKIMGVDSRTISQTHLNSRIQYKQIRYTRSHFEQLFRENDFDYVYHLARIGHSGQNPMLKRLEMNLVGTSRILEMCYRFGVTKVAVLSTFHVYGALADNSIFINEDAPLRASIKSPGLRDIVEMDQICTSWMWKHQNDISTVVLRPCNIIGPQINNTFTKYLKGPITLRPIDFNPVFQFIHEFDMANVLSRLLEEIPTGVYNVAPSEYITLGQALKITQPKAIPLPISLASSFSGILGLEKFGIPRYLIDYLKYSCLVDNSLLKEHLGEKFIRFSINETLKLIKST